MSATTVPLPSSPKPLAQDGSTTYPTYPAASTLEERDPHTLPNFDSQSLGSSNPSNSREMPHLTSLFSDIPACLRLRNLLDVNIFAPCRSLWMISHLCLPTFYCSEYRGLDDLLPRYASQDVGAAWGRQVVRLQEDWLIIQNISMMLLSITAPYLAITKASPRSTTFVFGSLCLLYTFIELSIVHIYANNKRNILKSITVEYWQKASASGHGLGFWTLLSLPAVWFVASVSFFLAFLFSAVWEDTSRDTSSSFYTGLVFLHRGMMIMAVIWACVHFTLIAIAWRRVRHDPIY